MYQFLFHPSFQNTYTMTTFIILRLPQSNYLYLKLSQKSCYGILTSTFTAAICSTADRSTE